MAGLRPRRRILQGKAREGQVPGPAGLCRPSGGGPRAVRHRHSGRRCRHRPYRSRYRNVSRRDRLRMLCQLLNERRRIAAPRDVRAVRVPRMRCGGDGRHQHTLACGMRLVGHQRHSLHHDGDRSLGVYVLQLDVQVLRPGPLKTSLIVSAGSYDGSLFATYLSSA